MHIASLLPRRALEVAAGAVVAVVAFLGVSLPLLVGGAVDDLARTAIVEGDVSEVTLSIGLPESADPDAQDAGVRAAIDADLGRNGPAVDVTRTVDGAAGVVTWTIEPRADTVTATSLESVPAAWRRMRTALSAEGVDTVDASFEGSLVPTTSTVRRQADALRAAAPIALTSVAAVALVAVGEIARLLALRRERRARLLWSRGARRSRMILDATTPPALAMLVGAAVGALAAPAVAGHPVGDAAGAPIWPMAAWVAAVVIVASRAVAAVRGFERAHDRDASRARRASLFVAVGLLVAVAGFAGWQTVRSGASDRADPVIVVAPAAALTALVVVGLLLSALVASPLERAVAAGRGWIASLWVRGVFRRGAVSITPLVLCALAVGQLVFAAGFAASWSQR